MTTVRRTAPLPGITAIYDGTCEVCSGPIIKGISRVYAKRGDWRHCDCAPGADDE